MDVVLRLSEDEAQRLVEQAERERRSIDDVVHTAVTEYLRSRREQRFREVVDEQLPRYQGVLDRLKET